MTDRPPVSPGLVAMLRTRVPSRVAARLDLEPELAEGWRWEAGYVTTSGGEVVTLPTAHPSSADDFQCTCLLNPFCVHVLAVAMRLPTEVASAAPHIPANEPPSAAIPTAVDPPRSADPVVLTRAQRDAVARTMHAAAVWLQVGAARVDAIAVEELARGVHAARAVGLHRLARAGRRVLSRTRELQQSAPSFRLDALVEVLAELFEVAWRLATPAPVASSWVGSARAVYRTVGALRLVGVCTEAVVADTGVSGVTSWLLDEHGGLWSVADIRPGDVDRVVSSYGSPILIGDITLTHRQLARGGLLLSAATATETGRLGTGVGVRAAAIPGARWDEAVFQPRWTTPVRDRLNGPLVFVEGTVRGRCNGALVVNVFGYGPVRFVPPVEHPSLYSRSNIALLARAPELKLRIVARAVDGDHALYPIAVAPGEGESRLLLPSRWGARCQLAFDQLVGAHVEGVLPQAPEVSLVHVAPLVPTHLWRRLSRVAMHGKTTLPGEVRHEVSTECRALQTQMMPTAASALWALAEATAGDTPQKLVQAWLAAAVVARVLRARTVW